MIVVSDKKIDFIKLFYEALNKPKSVAIVPRNRALVQSSKKGGTQMSANKYEQIYYADTLIYFIDNIGTNVKKTFHSLSELNNYLMENNILVVEKEFFSKLMNIKGYVFCGVVKCKSIKTLIVADKFSQLKQLMEKYTKK